MKNFKKVNLDIKFINRIFKNGNKYHIFKILRNFYLFFKIIENKYKKRFKFLKITEILFKKSVLNIIKPTFGLKSIAERNKKNIRILKSQFLKKNKYIKEIYSIFYLLIFKIKIRTLNLKIFYIIYILHICIGEYINIFEQSKVKYKKSPIFLKAIFFKKKKLKINVLRMFNYLHEFIEFFLFNDLFFIKNILNYLEFYKISIVNILNKIFFFFIYICFLYWNKILLVLIYFIDFCNEISYSWLFIVLYKNFSILLYFSIIIYSKQLENNLNFFKSYYNFKENMFYLKTNYRGDILDFIEFIIFPPIIITICHLAITFIIFEYFRFSVEVLENNFIKRLNYYFIKIKKLLTFIYKLNLIKIIDLIYIIFFELITILKNFSFIYKELKFNFIYFYKIFINFIKYKIIFYKNFIKINNNFYYINSYNCFRKKWIITFQKQNDKIYLNELIKNIAYNILNIFIKSFKKIKIFFININYFYKYNNKKNFYNIIFFSKKKKFNSWFLK